MNPGTPSVSSLLRAAYRKGLHQVSRVGAQGQNVFDESWDLLVVVDACRHDLFTEVVGDELSGLEVESRWSVDSMTREWMKKTFTRAQRDKQRRTRYICGNPFSSETLEGNCLSTLDEVWRYHWDDERGTLPPRPLTDRAIRHGREDRDEDRMIVHYMQPHWPFLDAPELSGGRGWDLDGFGDRTSDYRAWENTPHDVWERLRRGEVTRADVWRGYRQNLRRTMEEVELLLENYDAERAVVTSDHGNAAGEWGIYGHPMHMPFECLRRVPWAMTTATDQRRHEPDPENVRSNDIDDSVGEKLAQLGYVG